MGVHVGRLVILERRCSYVGSTFDKGRSIVSHRNKFLFKLGTNHTLERKHVVAIGVELEPHGGV